MKKKYIKFIATFFVLCSISTILWGCNKINKQEDVDYVKSCYKQTVNATTINQSFVIKNGDNLISSKEIEYKIMSDKSVTGTQKVTTLNPDINSTNLYIVKTDDIMISAQNSADSLPTSISLNRNDFVDGNYIFSKGEEYETFSFDLQQSGVAAFFGLTAEEASKITNVKVTIIIKDKKVTEYKATYITDKGNSVEININYNYAA